MSRKAASSVVSSGSTTTRPARSAARYSGSPVDRCAVSTTDSPRSSRARAVCDPIEPRPPVMRIIRAPRVPRCRWMWVTTLLSTLGRRALGGLNESCTSRAGRPRYAEGVDRAQAYDERLPLPALAPRVRTVWVQRTGPRPVLQRNLPTGGVELQCPIGAAPRLVGPLTRAKLEILPPGLTIVGARFWPGAASPLLGVPADELVDQLVPFGDVRDKSSDLSARLADAPGPDAALHMLQLDLLRRQARTPPPDSLVAE